MKRYCYCVVTDEGHSFLVDADVLGLVVSGHEDEGGVVPSTVGELLRDGWVPVRETPLGNNACLVLLARD